MSQYGPRIFVNDFGEFSETLLLFVLKYKKSPSKTVGFKPSKNFKKALHRIPMLSLANAFSEEDLLNFEKRTLNFISQNENFKIELQKV